MAHPKDIIEELLFVTTRMAQDLQEYVDEGEKSGSNMDATKALLEEFDKIYLLASTLSDIWQ